MEKKQQHTPELLPCPFCGGEAKKALIGNDYTKRRSVEVKCTQCFVKRVTAGIRSSHEQLTIWATEAWNKRYNEKRIASLTEQVEQRWISVEDGLPENNLQTEYLCILNGEVQMVKHWGGQFRMLGTSLSESEIVTHWQPLPPIPNNSPALTKKGGNNVI